MKLQKIIGLLMLTSSFMSYGQNLGDNESFTRIIKNETHSSTIALNAGTVRCSALGYGSAELKVTVPSLKWHAIFDHSNNDGNGPCMTAGITFCGFGNQNTIPDELLDPQRPNEELQVEVKLEETFIKTNSVCIRSLTEKIKTNIRGIDFTHTRSKGIGSISLEECNEIF